MTIRIPSRRIYCLLIAGLVLFASCSAEPATTENAQKELHRVLQVWKSGNFYINPNARRESFPEGGGDLSRFFGTRMDSMSLDSFEILSNKPTGKEGEFKFEVRLTVKSSSMSIMNPVPPRPHDVESSYYVYQGKGGWVVESAGMRAAKERILGK